ncbi:hypothetical protein B0H14DRAFT_3128867 [Mycena olivaceomarginata]|nr:hypothetical protein B0H14DRAFT_3128867 [Mycena olivaceomarginata]
MMINARHALCPEPLAPNFCPLLANASMGPTKANTTLLASTKLMDPATSSGSSVCTLATPPSRTTLCVPLRSLLPRQPPRNPRPARVQMHLLHSSRKRPSARCAVARIHETRPPALSTSTREILDAGLAEAAAAFPAPPRRQHELLDAEAAAAFPAPRRRQHELPHQRLARQQEAVARLAALTPLPPSPTLSQEERDEVLALRLAVGTSPPPSITAPHTRRISLVSWVLGREASTTVVQDVAGWALTWPTIHLTDLAPFLLSPVHSRLDAYYELFNFRMGQWVAIPQAYAFDVVTDEPVLLRCVGLRCVGTVADDEDEVIASFARFINRSLYPVHLPAAASRKRQRVTTPTSRRLGKRRKYEPEPAGSSSDEARGQRGDPDREDGARDAAHIPSPSCTRRPAIHSHHRVHLAPPAQLLAAPCGVQLASLHFVVVRGTPCIIVLPLPFYSFPGFQLFLGLFIVAGLRRVVFLQSHSVL